MVRDYLDRALLDIATFYRDTLMIQCGSKNEEVLVNGDMEQEIAIIARATSAENTLRKLEAIMRTRTNLSRNAAPLLAVEAMMVQLR